MTQHSTPEDVKQLVLIRMETLSSHKKISIGSYGEFSKEEIIQHIKDDDEIGKKMIQVEMEFLRALKKGII
ncbi:MAG TPA: hypothetical protein VJJ21_00905 [Candidatus Nanoarchaeia archaeon]|nr:hypothetical protein [Candidatus Nanoarchaeia archaeon]